MDDYVNSLNALRQLDVKLILPGHENHFTGLGERVEELIRHHDQRNLEILEQILKSIGLRVTVLPNKADVYTVLQQALEAQDPFDLCIVDVKANKENDFNISRQIIELKDQHPNLLMIAQSYSIAALDLDKCREFGFDRYLKKPVRKDTVIRILEELIEKENEEHRIEKEKEKPLFDESVLEAGEETPAEEETTAETLFDETAQETEKDAGAVAEDDAPADETEQATLGETETEPEDAAEEAAEKDEEAASAEVEPEDTDIAEEPAEDTEEKDRNKEPAG